MEVPALYLEKLMRTTEIPERFQLTEEQLVQIAIEESIQLTDSMHIYLTLTMSFCRLLY